MSTDHTTDNVVAQNELGDTVTDKSRNCLNQSMM
jgi:hypothetical protein